jgi:methyl-accepting chemotaxis protein
VTIRAKLILLLGIFAASVAGFSALSYASLEPDIATSRYSVLVTDSELVADVLPPPEYIVESHLTLMQMSVYDASARAELERKFERLRSEFVTRHHYWSGKLATGALRDALLVDAYEPAVRYYETAEREYLPALRRGDTERAQTLISGSLRELYDSHRSAVDRVVELANETSRRDAASIHESVQTRRALLVGFGLVLAIIAAAIGFWIEQSIARGLIDIRKVLDAAAGRNLSVRMSTERRDELGQIGRAINQALEGISGALIRVRGTSREFSRRLPASRRRRPVSKRSRPLPRGTPTMLSRRALFRARPVVMPSEAETSCTTRSRRWPRSIAWRIA